MITLEEEREMGLMRKQVYADVFKQAVEDLISWDLTIKLQALYWFQSSSREPYSFLWICDLFDFNPELVLESLAISEIPGNVSESTHEKARGFLERWNHSEKVEKATEAKLEVAYEN